MPKSDPLYLLIKAMTKTEKRYFKLHKPKSEANAGKDYLRLFDAIEAQRVYDERAIRVKFKGEPYFNQLGVVKIYLYRQIMKSLKNFYDDASCNMKLNNYLIEIEVLRRKGLYKNCISTIKKAKAYATKYEKFPKLLELISWESTMSMVNFDVDQIESNKNKWIEEKQEVLKKLDEINAIQKLTYDYLSVFLRKGQAKTQQEKEIVYRFLSDQSVRKSLSSFLAEDNRLSLIANCYMALGKLEDRLQAIIKESELWNLYPHQIEEHINTYFFNLRELADLSLSLKKYALAESIIEKLHVVYEKKSLQLNVINHVGYINIKAAWLCEQGKIIQASAFHSEIDRLVENNLKNPSPHEEMYIALVHFNIYFRNSDYKNTQDCIRKIIDGDAHIHFEVHSMMRIANLIIQYDQREYQHLGYVLRSTYRYLLKKQRLFETESAILNFLSKTGKFTSDKQVLNALAELKQQILPYQHEPFLVDFPLVEWIDSKLQNKSLADVIRENYLCSIKKEEMAELKIAV